jgi:hypothetical protein
MTIRNERGAVLIHVTVMLLALFALSGIVLDYGAMWASRTQIQTSADAGALAGAISYAFDDVGNQATARERAQALALANGVWGEAPDVQPDDVTFPTCPPGSPGIADTCVKVDAFRNQARANPLPTFFMSLFGASEQGVVATATAQVALGSVTNCLKPWAVVDQWLEAGEPFNLSSTYDKYSDGNGNNPPPEADVYTPPSATDPGTGWQFPRDSGRQFAIKIGASGDPVSSGWFRTLDLPRADTTQMGNDTVQNNITSCNGLPSTFAAPTTVCPSSITGHDEAAYWANLGCYRVQTGVAAGSTANSVEELMARDNDAHWDGTRIVGSTFRQPTSSPRVVPVGVLDVDWYLSQEPTGSNGIARLVNIYGFFIEGIGDVDRHTGEIQFPAAHGQAVIGRLISLPATGINGNALVNSASFLRKIILIR